MELERLRELYESIAVAGLERTVARGAPHYEHNVTFVKQRFQEGVELDAYFHDKYSGKPLRILDLGAGTGGVSAPLAASRSPYPVSLSPSTSRAKAGMSTG